MRDLAQRVNYNLQMATAERYLAQGNMTAASNTLKALSATPPKNPVDAGKLARMLARTGDLTTAVSLVRDNMKQGVQGNAGDYADQVAVLNPEGGPESGSAEFCLQPGTAIAQHPCAIGGSA